jgi:hypothetical protein
VLLSFIAKVEILKPFYERRSSLARCYRTSPFIADLRTESLDEIKGRRPQHFWFLSPVCTGTIPRAIAFVPFDEGWTTICQVIRWAGN